MENTSLNALYTFKTIIMENDPQEVVSIPAAEPEAVFVTQKVQPALLGLMDGSVSTLAPIFAVAGLTGDPHKAFFVGLAASLGAGISMGLAEALSDDGKVTGRGKPITRGSITALGTTIGGMLHSLSFSDTGSFHCTTRCLHSGNFGTIRYRHHKIQVYENTTHINDTPGDRRRWYRVFNWNLVG